MMKEKLTKELKGEGIKREKFWKESESQLTLEEVNIIENITKSRNISCTTIKLLTFAIQENINKDFINKLSIIIAKIQNILDDPELIKIKAKSYKLDEKMENLTSNVNESLDELTKDKRKELDVIARELRINNEVEDFIINSYMPLTEEEIETINNVLSEDITRVNAIKYLDQIEEAVFESTWIDGKENYVEEYTNKLNLIVAKLRNMKKSISDNR